MYLGGSEKLLVDKVRIAKLIRGDTINLFMIGK